MTDEELSKALEGLAEAGALTAKGLLIITEEMRKMHETLAGLERRIDAMKER